MSEIKKSNKFNYVVLGFAIIALVVSLSTWNANHRSQVKVNDLGIKEEKYKIDWEAKTALDIDNNATYPIEYIQCRRRVNGEIVIGKGYGFVASDPVTGYGPIIRVSECGAFDFKKQWESRCKSTKDNDLLEICNRMEEHDTSQIPQ